MRQYFGKYRGTVVNNTDPMFLGRVQVNVPAVLGTGQLSWAMPCVPYAGAGVGFFAIPPVGASIWVEFEEGKPDLPIWVGGYWSTGELPNPTGLAAVKILKTSLVTVKLDDTPGAGGLTLEVAGSVPAKLTMGATGIEITYGKNKVALTASSVTVNDGALEVI